MASEVAKGTLLERTQELLKESGKTSLDIFRDTNIPYYWLNQFRDGRSRDPSVNRVQALYEYLSGTKLEVK
jgi:hypothetical protein